MLLKRLWLRHDPLLRRISALSSSNNFDEAISLLMREAKKSEDPALYKAALKLKIAEYERADNSSKWRIYVDEALRDLRRRGRSRKRGVSNKYVKGLLNSTVLPPEFDKLRRKYGDKMTKAAFKYLQNYIQSLFD